MMNLEEKADWSGENDAVKKDPGDLRQEENCFYLFITMVEVFRSSVKIESGQKSEKHDRVFSIMLHESQKACKSCVASVDNFREK
ncbi:MAG: hypothetical protein HUJ74_01865 [Lachnospiraceae bacterium]|nr:hypothetical protein [Lachnospiraceae bacterium]